MLYIAFFGTYTFGNLMAFKQHLLDFMNFMNLIIFIKFDKIKNLIFNTIDKFNNFDKI